MVGLRLHDSLCTAGAVVGMTLATTPAFVAAPSVPSWPTSVLVGAAYTPACRVHGSDRYSTYCRHRLARANVISCALTNLNSMEDDQLRVMFAPCCYLLADNGKESHVSRKKRGSHGEYMVPDGRQGTA